MEKWALTLLPSPDYHQIWRHVDKILPAHKAWRYIVRLLHLAASQQCESALGRYVLNHIDQGELPNELQCRQRFGVESTVIPLITGKQHNLGDYDQLLGQEVQHG